MNYTTIEQSKKLVELGLNPESADMLWEQHNNTKSYVTVKPWTTKGKSLGPHIIPCWSLGALLELMPDGTSIFYKYNYTTIDMVDVNNGVVRNKHREKGPTPFDAAFSMVVWLLENNYIKTEKK